MMDTYNLGWKLAHVLQGKANPDILKTYQAERLQTARELIDLDYKLSRMFSAKPSEDGTGVSMKKFEEVCSLIRFLIIQQAADRVSLRSSSSN